MRVFLLFSKSEVSKLPFHSNAISILLLLKNHFCSFLSRLLLFRWRTLTTFFFFYCSPFPINFCFNFSCEKKRTFSFPQLLSHSETCYFYTYVVLFANYSLTINKTTCLYTDGGLHLQFSFCDRQIIFFDVIAACILNVLQVMHIDQVCMLCFTLLPLKKR